MNCLAWAAKDIKMTYKPIKEILGNWVIKLRLGTNIVYSIGQYLVHKIDSSMPSDVIV